MMRDRPLTEDERATFSMMGVIRFDALAVAKALRSRPLSLLEAHGLANLLDGKQSDGLRLKMTGQGRNWVSIKEGADRYDRLKSITEMMDRLLSEGESWEQATLATAEHFEVSESTVSRHVSLARSAQSFEK